MEEFKDAQVIDFTSYLRSKELDKFNREVKIVIKKLTDSINECHVRRAMKSACNELSHF